MLVLEVLVRELASVDALATNAGAMRKVAALAQDAGKPM
jgi:hypothetical protein